MAALSLVACASVEDPPAPTSSDLDDQATRFVRLALALGEHDTDYVDAYHGPDDWREAARAAEVPLEAILAAAGALVADLQASRADSEIDERRRAYLVGQTRALAFRTRMLMGERFSFDEESQGLYDAVAPRFDEAHFQAIIDDLAALLPGEGGLAARRSTYQARFEIPRERLDAVFRAAIDECERRTERWIGLPPDESFTLEYVNDKSWSGYNWFQGRSRSLIQINTDLPIYIERAIKLACHEGYPGHHVYNSLLEAELLRDRGWVEFSIFPLFGPSGLIAEGSANYGVKLAFPDAERIEFEKRVLFPLAGLDAAEADNYYAIKRLTDRLAYADNEAARRYLDGEITRDQAEAWLVRYGLYAPERAAQRVRFFDQYRAYVINYNLGEDLVAAFVERDGGDASSRWLRFTRLLSEPWLPSQLNP